MTQDTPNPNPESDLPVRQPGIRPHWLPLALVIVVAACCGIMRITAPPNLLDQSQERPASYVLDAVKNGNWLCQRDFSGDITSKPPLYTWLCGALTVANGRISIATLYLPCVLAGAGVAWLLLAFGRKPFGTTAAMFGALMFLLCPVGLKLLGQARTDGVFTFMVTATALLAWRAWNRGRGWTWFWLCAGLATLTKGPLGLLLGAFGLLAAVWEKRRGTPHPVRGSQWPGVLLFVLISAGWFGLAYLAEGQALVDKMLGKELVGNAIARGQHRFPGTLIWQPPLFYLGRCAPWSLLAYYGLWRIWRQPAGAALTRRFERFLWCWFVAGLLVFSISPHQRADLLWPLTPAAALIAGRELDQITRRFAPAQLIRGTIVFAALFLVGYGLYYYVVRAHQPVIKDTIALQRFAEQIEAQTGAEPPLTFVDAPWVKMTDAPASLQVYLNIYRRPVTAARAASVLRGRDAAWVALSDPAVLDPWRRTNDPPLFTVMTGSEQARPKTRILSNRPDLEPRPALAFAYGPLDVRVQDGRLLLVAERCLRVHAESGGCSVTVSNAFDLALPYRVEFVRGEKLQTDQRMLKAHEAWTVKVKE